MIRSSRRFIVFAVSFLAMFCIPTLLRAQNATVTGRVTDPSGAVIPKAHVVATRAETSTNTIVETNQEGWFVLPSLPPGHYRVTVSREGFKSVTKIDLELHLQDIISQNFTLPIGDASTSITVTSGGININATDGSVSTLVDATTVANMPLNGRSFQNLLLLTPGVSTQNPNGTESMGSFSVNGQRTDANYFTVDGVSANNGLPHVGKTISGISPASTVTGSTQALVSVDDLQEFRVQSSTYSAQYGRTPGGQFAFETKSGTNTFHGDAFDYLRNNAVGGADPWFNNYTKCYAINPNTHQPGCSNFLQQNDFGGSLGGPVRIPGLYNGKDKTFFFVNYEGLRLKVPDSGSVRAVPDDCMRGLTNTTSNPTTTYNSAGQCLSNGALINGIQGHPRLLAATNLLPIMRSFPLPTIQEFNDGNGAGTDGFGAVVLGYTQPYSINSTSARLDQVINDKMTVFFRFSDTNSMTTGINNGDELVPTSTVVHTYTAGVNNSFSSRWNNELRFSYAYNYLSQGMFISSFGGSTPVNLATLAGVAGIGGASPLVQFTFGADTPTGGLNPTQSVNYAIQHQWNAVDTLSYAVGAHQFKFGVDYLRSSPETLNANPSVGYQYDYEPQIESGTFDSLQLQARLNQYQVYNSFSAFAQDTWKVTPRLTLDFGLRWELNPAPGVSQGSMPYGLTGTNLSNYALNCANGPQLTITSGCVPGAPLYATTWFNFAPRFGAAYVIRDTPGWETVLRGGGGVFFDTGQEQGSFSYGNFGTSARSTVSNGTDFPLTSPCTGIVYGGPQSTTNPCIFPGYSASELPSLAAPRGQLQYIYGFDPHLQLPYTLQWNVSIQQQLGRAQALTISYVGSHGSRLLQQNEYANAFISPGNPNIFPVNARTFPDGGGVLLVENKGNSDYDALQLQFQHTLSKGLSVLGSYTWSHCIDEGSASVQIGYQRGNCDYDLRHNFTGSFSYDLPNVGGNAIVKAIADHWGVDNYFTVRSGFPIWPITTLNAPDPVTRNSQLPAYYLEVPGEPLYLTGQACVNFYSAEVGTAGTVNAFAAQGVPNVCPGGKSLNPCAFEVSSGGTIGTPGTNGAVSLTPAPQARQHYGCPYVTTGLSLLPRNQLRLWGLWEDDIAIRREFPIYQRLKLQFRAEAFNIFNHPSFAGANTGLGNTFGLSSSTVNSSLASTSATGLAASYGAGGPRVMQFALKLIF